jgi:hypothetical protein
MKLIEGSGMVDQGAVSQIRTCDKTADRAALVADHNKGYAVPVGGIVAYNCWVENFRPFPPRINAA